MTLANNHVLDFEEEGLFDTLGALDDAGIARAGAGGDLAEAREPAMITVFAETIGGGGGAPPPPHRARDDATAAAAATAAGAGGVAGQEAAEAAQQKQEEKSAAAGRRRVPVEIALLSASDHPEEWCGQRAACCSSSRRFFDPLPGRGAGADSRTSSPPRPLAPHTTDDRRAATPNSPGINLLDVPSAAAVAWARDAAASARARGADLVVFGCHYGGNWVLGCAAARQRRGSRSTRMTTQHPKTTSRL